MALLPEELEQIRRIVREEQKPTSFWQGAAGCGLLLLFAFLGVLALHVIVIGGMTVYYLLHPH